MNSFCPGRDTIIVNQGFWRASQSSDHIYECLYPEACLGGNGTISSSLSGVECNIGYYHNLCHECIYNEEMQFTKSGKHKCSKCGDATENFLKLFGIFIVIIIYVSALIWINLRKSKDSSYSILFRIMTNYIQVVGTTATFNLAWPDEILGF